jgi:tetratricopeptide (TPR) repeat protein
VGALWLSVGLLVGSCATLGESGQARVEQTGQESLAKRKDGAITLDGVVVLAQPDSATGLSAYDPDDLFHRAGEEERLGRPQRAITLYSRLLEHFPESLLAQASAFNLGLLYENAQVWEKAIWAYGLITRKLLPIDDERRRVWLDAHFRTAVSWTKADQWWRAVAVFDEILEHEWLFDEDRIEAMLGRGISIQEAGNWEAAEGAFVEVLRLGKTLSRAGYYEDHFKMAEAAFRMGQIAKGRYQEIELSFPVEHLRDSLKRKCETLLQAQHRFLLAIRHGDQHTVAAAGFEIGSLYEALYHTIVNLETPDDLSDDEAMVYGEEVRNRVQVLVKKALRIYERVLIVGRRATTARAWIVRLEEAILRIQDLLLDETRKALQEIGSEALSKTSEPDAATTE